MGIPGILKEIGKGERVALAKLAIDHLERTKRPLRVAIDAAIWNFQNQSAQGGKNPALRTLFFRLLRLLALPIHPVFVYDGKNKPLTKRGRTVSRYGTCIENETARQLLSVFRFPHHTAPGEAEAECAFLQRKGVVDAVMSQDVDAIMFGSVLTLRDWSKEGTKGNKAPTHVNVLDLPRIKQVSGLDPDGMILVALLSGGDYNEDGVPGFGSGLACEVARAGFGTDLLECVRNSDDAGIQDWRERLQYELETNESGYFKTRHMKIKVPNNFPDHTILDYYTNPAVSKQDDLPNLEKKWTKEWRSELDVVALRQYTATSFDWNWKSGARRFVRCMAQPMLQYRLQSGVFTSSAFAVDDIVGERRHFINDGILELRLNVIPAQVVEIDIEAEEDNPEYLADQESEDADVAGGLEIPDDITEQSNDLSNSSRPRRVPWSPYIAEKWWIPHTVLMQGIPAVVKSYQQKQQEIRNDPRRFATRKCPKASQSTKLLKGAKTLDKQMRTGAMHGFLVEQSSENLLLQGGAKITARNIPQTPRKSRVRPQTEETTPSIARFFKPQKPVALELYAEKNDEAFAETHGSKDSIVHKESFISSVNHLPPPSSSKPSTGVFSAQLDGSQLRGQHKEKQGKSVVNGCISSIVTIESSPERPSDVLKTESETDAMQQIHITQRHKRRVGTRQRRSVDRLDQHVQDGLLPLSSPDLQDIGSYFNPHLRLGLIGEKPEDLTASSREDVLNQSTTAAKLRTRLIAASRDSLPGTWAEVEQMDTSHISYIDLTSD